jgi:transcriptional regulator of aromatic amino acid metabolism
LFVVIVFHGVFIFSFLLMVRPRLPKIQVQELQSYDWPGNVRDILRPLFVLQKLLGVSLQISYF